MNLTVIAIHAPALATHHHGGGVTTAAPAHHSTVMNLATALAAVEIVAAAAVLYSRTRAVRPDRHQPVHQCASLSQPSSGQGVGGRRD
jgi:hypothetical protein